MFVTEDGTVTGSVDVSKLDQVQPKTDEAKAQLGTMKAEAKAGQEQAARDAERLAEQHRLQGGVLFERSAFNEEGNRGESSRSQAEQRKDAERQQAEHDKQATQEQSAEVTQLQAEAEAAGITVDKRWGADRLRQELASQQAGKGKGR